MKAAELTIVDNVGILGITPRELDQFFTKPEVAKECVQELISFLESENLNVFEKIVEPSFGQGAFVNAIKEHITDKLQLVIMDIDARDEQLRQNFLTFDHSRGLESVNCLTIGNPPFGKSCALAIEFFNKSAQFSSIIAFIVR